MPKKSILHWVRLAVTSALIAYVIHQAGLSTREGWRNLWQTLAEVNLLFLSLAIGVGLITMLASSFKWYMLLRSRGLQVKLWRLYAYYIIGRFFSIILPTTMGSDVVRMHQLGQYSGRYADAVASIFVDRLSGMITLVVLALLSIFANLHLFHQPWSLLGLGLAVGIATLLIGWLVVDERPSNKMRHLVGKRRISWLDRFGEKLAKFRQAVLAYQDKPMALLIAFINSLLFYFLAAVNVWVTILPFDTTQSFTPMLIAVPIVLLIMNLPISLGDLGLMEFSYSFVLGLFGIQPTIAISAALLMRAKGFLYAGFGGLVYSVLNNEPSMVDK